MMKFLQNIGGTAGLECAVLLAMAAATFLMSGHVISFDALQFGSGNL